MILIKTADEIELMRESNLLVSLTLAELAKFIKPGVSTERLDQIAEAFIRDHGAVPGFLGYQGYPKTLCTSVNSEVVHGIPSEKVILKEGDQLSVDCGVVKNGFYGDTAFSFEVGEVSAEVRRLLDITRECLQKGVEQAVEGKRIGDIGNAVQNHAESMGYTVVREMVGHGLGRHLHEAPEVPNYGRRGTGPKLKKGMVICIEPMINMGRRQIKQDPDGWTIRTADKKPSAHFEWAVAIDKGKADVLSTFSYIDDELLKQSK
ncbi:MAG: type I methionyl aminopeptidase [Bacteroidetes bacterium]|nr:MAG: type I methionyl aminopeptidase [Bacteroidota bacterium]RLD92902.1 MAG: type I methionyl aminopeptidase [Bacteroidota bacterium]